MNYEHNKRIFLEILKCQTSEDLEKIVINEKLDQEGWLPYGGRSQNAGTVDGQMREADNALMEKITNSIDAILMRRCYEEGVDPRDRNSAPKTVDDAVKRFFGGREMLRENRSSYAKEWLRLTAEGRKDRPTITIIDKGEGQQPNKIKDTILSLNRDIKEKIPFVYGTYNQGGSSPLGFSGKSSNYEDNCFNYLQLVLCRRPPSINDKEKDENYDHFGFSIVRKRFDVASEKFTYEYLVEKYTENIFSFPADHPIEVDDYKFEEGCLIKLYDYQLPQRGNIVFKGLNEFIDKKLPILPLPIYLKELREYGGGIDYSVFGLKEKLIRKKESLLKGYPQKLPVDLGEIGKKEVELFILKHKAECGEDSLEMKERVFFIKDGLVLHTENMSWLRNECDLVDLAPYLFVLIDISTISPPIAQMLHSGREKFKNNATTRLALKRLKIFLENETLKNLDREYSKLTFSSESSFKDKAIQKELMKEVEKDPDLRELFDIGEDFPIKDNKKGKEVSQDPDYEGTYLPERFELVGADPREVEEGSYCKISFDTGADDKLFERMEDRGEYDWDKSENYQIAFSSFKNGKLTFRVDSNIGVSAPQEEALVFRLRVPSKDVEMIGVVTVLLKKKIPYEGKEYPTFFIPPKRIKIAVNGKTRLRVQTDAANDYLHREESPGVIRFGGHEDIEFKKPRLKDGFLVIGLNCLSNKLKESEDITILIKDIQNEFNLTIPVKIVLSDMDPQVDLPAIASIGREDWDNDTPKWDEDIIARIPTWRELKKIKINIDSRPFEELKKLPGQKREAAKDFLIKQIYINSIWLFLELKDLRLGESEESNGSDVKGEVFEKAIKATSKMLIQNINKFIR